MKQFSGKKGVRQLTRIVKAALAMKADAEHSHGVATSSNNGFISTADKVKLDSVENGANKYTHPSYTANTSGLYKIQSDASGHVTAATPVTKSDITQLGIPAQDTTYSAASSATNGLMSSADKSKLDGIAAGANKYVHPAYSAKDAGLYKISVDATGHVVTATAIAKSDITALGIPAQDTTYGTMTAATASVAGKAGLVPAPAAGAQAKYLRGDGTWQTPPTGTSTVATTSANGLMSSSDKSKLDKITAPASTGYVIQKDSNGFYIEV